MFIDLLKKLSILKKFLFINFIFFSIISVFTILYLKTVQPNLIQKKTGNHIKVIDNTIEHISRLKIKFEEGLDRTVDWYLSNSDWVDQIINGSYQEYYKKMYLNR
mgnify:CR=1 FL=1